MRFLCVALLLVSPAAGTTRAADPPASVAEPAAVLLNVSEKDLNRIVVDAFHRNGGPRFAGEKGRVSSSVADLRYQAHFSDPVIRLGRDGNARLSLDILDASLRIGRLEKKIGGRLAQCEEAGVDVDAASPLAVDVAFDLAIENGAFRVHPKSVEIPEAGERLRLVEPARCRNSPFPRWLLWWLGKPYLRRSIANLDEIVLGRARTSAARLEAKGNQLTKRWESLLLFPDSLDTTGGSLLFGLAAASPGAVSRPAPARRPEGAEALPSGSFLGLSETFVNETSRRVTAKKAASPRRSSANFRRLLASDAAYALIPGLRKLDSNASVYFEVAFPSAPQFEFRRQEGPEPASGGGDALIRVVLSGVKIEIRKDEGERKTLLGTLHIDSGRMAVVPFINVLGGISFRLVENDWKVSSTGLAFDEDLVAATLQEITFGKIFATTYAPLVSRALRLGETEFVPRSFAVASGYLVIGLGEPKPLEGETPVAAAKRRETPLGSH